MTALEKELLSPFDPEQERGDLSLSYKLLHIIKSIETVTNP